MSNPIQSQSNVPSIEGWSRGWTTRCTRAPRKRAGGKNEDRRRRLSIASCGSWGKSTAPRGRWKVSTRTLRTWQRRTSTARRTVPTPAPATSATSSTLPPSRSPRRSRKVARSAPRSASHPPRPICRGSPKSLECPCVCCTCSNSMAPPGTRNYGVSAAEFILEINRETALALRYRWIWTISMASNMEYNGELTWQKFTLPTPNVNFNFNEFVSKERRE